MGATPQTASYSSFPTQVYAFRDDLAPPRPLYFTYIPAVLLFAGILSWAISGDIGLVLACVTATVVSVYTLWEWLFRHAPTRFSTLLAMSLLLGYGGGALNTWLTLPRGPLTLGEVMGLGQGVLARGIAAVLFSSATLYFLGEIFEKPLFGQSFRLQIDETTRSLICIAALGMLGGYATHILAIDGAVASGGRVSIPGTFLTWLYAPVATLAIAGFLASKGTRDRFLVGLAALVFLLMFSINGRRAAIYTTVEILFVLALSGYRWRGRGMRNVLLIASLGVMIVAGGLAFMLLRIAPLTHPLHGQLSMAKRFQAADRLMKRGNAITLAAKATRQNVQTRTLILAFLANVFDASSTKTPALGYDALGLLEISIPRFIYPEKDRYFSEENLVDRQFGFNYGDQANSVLTAGATDFGMIGIIFYPLLLILLVRAVYGFLSRFLKPLPLLIVSLALIYLFLQTEITLTGYFSAIRDTIIFGIVIQAIVSLPRFKLRPQHADLQS